MASGSRQIRAAIARQELVAPLPAAFQGEMAFEYDLARYRFLEVLRAVLREPADADLAQLHRTQRGVEVIERFAASSSKVQLGPRDNPWNAIFTTAIQQDEGGHFSRLLEVYSDFIQNVVLDHLQTDSVAFQKLPTFRCHMPGTGAMGRPHRDEDYGHPRCEVNFWVPLTSLSGSNSLYAESKRGLGDFRPFQLNVGHAMRFYGNQVWHYTVQNETTASRVSLDFRVIREQEWSEEVFPLFGLGQHFEVMTRKGLTPRGSAEMRRLQEAYGCTPPPKKRLKEGDDQETMTR